MSAAHRLKREQFLPGHVIDSAYQVESFLGEGGMGQVYKVTHSGLKKTFALKIVTERRVDLRSLQRFQKEARLSARLNHPGLARIHNYGIDQGTFPYLVMDFAEGETLQQKLKRDGRLPVKRAIRLFIELSRVLEYAHSKGIVHRDIKPSNIMMHGDSIVVLDFGIAREALGDNFEEQSLTKSGEIVGSPPYMSPEQCLGRPVDAKSDIYSLGCTFHEVLSGYPPFKGESAFKTVMMQVNMAHPKLFSAADEDPRLLKLQTILNRCLAKRPEERYFSAGELRVELEKLLLKQDKEPAQEAVSVVEPACRKSLFLKWRQKFWQGPGSWFSAFFLAAILVAALTLSLLIIIPAERTRHNFNYTVKIDPEIQHTFPLAKAALAACEGAADEDGSEDFGPTGLKVSCQTFEQAVEERINSQPALQGLELNCREMNGHTLKGIKRLRFLSSLALHGINGDCAPLLDDLRGSRLIALELARMNLSKRALDDIAACPKIERLTMAVCRFKQVDLSFLRRMPQLKVLNLRDYMPTRHDIETLKTLKKLKTLQIGPFDGNETAAASLCRQLPGVQVYTHSGNYLRTMMKDTEISEVIKKSLK